MIVKLTGWQEGLKKITLTKLQTEFFQMSLKEAKNNVDKLLEGEEIEIETKSLDAAQNFVLKAKEAGTICEIIK